MPFLVPLSVPDPVIRCGRKVASFAREGGRFWARWRCVQERPKLRGFPNFYAQDAGTALPCRSSKGVAWPIMGASGALAATPRRAACFSREISRDRSVDDAQQDGGAPQVASLAARDMLRCATRARIDATVVTGVAAKSWRV